MNPDASKSARHGRFFYGWWVLIVCSVLALFGGSMSASLSVLVVPMQEDLGFEILTVGQLIAGGVVVGNLAAMVVGWTADRFGARPLVLFGGLVAGLGLVLFSQADSFWPFLLMFAAAFGGVTFGFGLVTLVSLVNHWFARHRSLALATLMTMFSLGRAGLPILLALGVTYLNWRDVALYSGFFLSALAVLGWLALRSRPEDKGLYPDGDATPPFTPDFTVREALRTGAFWAMILGGFLINDAAQTTLENFHPAMLAAMSVLAILLTFGLGVAAGRFPARKILSVGLAIGAVGQLGLLDLDNDLAAVMFPLSVAVVQGGSAVYWIMVGDYYGRTRFASIMGLMVLSRALGIIPVGIPIALIQIFGAPQLTTVFYFLLYAAAAVALWFARRPPAPERALPSEDMSA